MKNQFPHPFSDLAREYRKFRRKLPDAISTMAVNDFKENFKRQGYYDEKGKFHPWKERKKAKKRGRGKSTILVESARLKRGIKKAPTYDAARVTNSVIYAKRHNEGYEQTPARPFMVTSKQLLDDIDKFTLESLDKIFKSL